MSKIYDVTIRSYIDAPSIHAIKHIRYSLGLGLKEAKDLHDSLRNLGSHCEVVIRMKEDAVLRLNGYQLLNPDHDNLLSILSVKWVEVPVGPTFDFS